ncbi:thioesterase family protein [Amylibacter sp. IMCC11727]|uniref:acyl-CoA thioesterase n=1 Tax=Amylibacter sp. IMCC11727 TaxID=3039851 RepID=UPI00244E1264|nr:thioesterase family protein [Amylibacter sp. IMCC11727]WGI21092.1 thioesterase family protein [Amylibacter sp. IMCC11727]
MTKYIDTHAFTVRPSDCDALGHMNVARYLDGCSDAGFSLQSVWSLTPEDIRDGRQLAFVVAHADSNFLRELRIGDHIQVRSELIKAGTKSCKVCHHFFLDDTEVFNSTFTLVLMNLKTRKAEAMPDDLRVSLLAAHA